ncbi:LemA family protein [Aliarcobacter butzleri]|uniref:LemA family protein n=1 Tax=Aliarcobacter butzleri TaxID=28197 RepID=A0AAP4PTL8_9BACT|nr:LemA family protein [Aliarcobacter butzleri]MCG3662822.1 LemA family protein [Aliarcobacter butzleri]MCT7651379.1 LemA family protein [Aliarcobacter butzleri]MDN5064338.1 LemA family protein [Aliarcobacter butzleri]MDN5067008.1 LemA family protein [Aliarcobacter butzleri]MDN5077565.1 LemA family protein [Aliarcobacter butzleri]
MRKISLVLGLILLAIIYLTVTNYNNIPKLDENVKEKWSQVQNQYKRRADLIPNLVETVKAYANHEKSTLVEVTEARSKVSQITLNENTLNNPELLQQFENAQSNLTSALSKLMVVVEKYPELKANENFLSLQSQLEGTENRITVARRDFIEAVKLYNLELRTMPGKFVAAIAHPEAKIKETFTASPTEQDAPKVKF